MHQLPGGESPGWTTPQWFVFDLTHSNNWNAPLTVMNKSNQRELTYFADFAQTTFVFNFGLQILNSLAVSAELPVAVRHGGFLDTVIDNWHEAINVNRFNRDEYAADQNILNFKTDGVSDLDYASRSGLSNVRFKAKWWPIQWKGSAKGCPCGLAGSFQVKVPLNKSRSGLTSGSFDFTTMFHLGLPLGQTGAFLFNLAFHYLPKNKPLTHWPRNKFLGMAEVVIDIPITDSFHILLFDRLESPFMDVAQLNVVDGSPELIARQNRISSGWNGLVYWRNVVSLGFSFAVSDRLTLTTLVIEDAGIGDRDNNGDTTYVFNAPDIMATLQFNWGL